MATKSEITASAATVDSLDQISQFAARLVSIHCRHDLATCRHRDKNLPDYFKLHCCRPSANRAIPCDRIIEEDSVRDGVDAAFGEDQPPIFRTGVAQPYSFPTARREACKPATVF